MKHKNTNKWIISIDSECSGKMINQEVGVRDLGGRNAVRFGMSSMWAVWLRLI